MLSFTLTEEQDMIRQMARNFAKKEILPVAEHYDQSDEFPWPIIRKAQKTGLISSNVPEAYGGPGLGVLEECIINEELAWACSGVQTAIMLNNLAAWPIILAGSAEQKARYLPRLTEGGQLAAYGLTEPAAGSDVAGILSTAVRKGDAYILNGAKTWITNAPVASFLIIFAKTDPEARHRGMSAFIVERDWPGVTCGKPIPKMGQHAAWTGEIVLEDVCVPAENRLGTDGDGFSTARGPPWRPRPWGSRGGRWTRPRATRWRAKRSASRSPHCKLSVSCWQTWR
jgi:acyl-CoA dehydrogenase